MAIPFLKAENEDDLTQAIAFVGIVVMTIGLTVMNVSGALAGSQSNNTLGMVIRVALAVIISGAEVLAAVALVRAMLAPNRLRRVVALLIFVGLAWACIQNGKKAIHLVYPEFKESAALLEAKAEIAGDEAQLIATARGKAIDATPAELAKVRTDIAALKAEQQLMASQSPEKIKEAQSLLIAQGKYFGRVDGIRADLTEAAMRARGEEIARELTNLGLREEALAAGAVTAAAGVAATAENPAVLQADLQDRARRAKEAALWLEIMLWVFEAARGLGLWALVSREVKRKENDMLAGASLSDDLPPGHARWEGPEDELQAMMAAVKVHENIKQGAKKGARTRRVGNKIEAGDTYYRDKISEFMVQHNQGLSTAQIAAKAGLTVASLRSSYLAHMTPEEQFALFGIGYQDEPEAEPPVAAPTTLGDYMPETQPAEEEPEPPVAMADSPHPEDDLEIPPEPQEYPMAPYQPPANEDQDPKEAA